MTEERKEQSAAATITVSGAPRPWRGQTVRDLVVEYGIDPTRRGIAVAVNARVVPRRAWETTRLAPGDRVEIVTPKAGG